MRYSIKARDTYGPIFDRVAQAENDKRKAELHKIEDSQQTPAFKGRTNNIDF